MPAANPLTRAKAELGMRLFFDPVLSRDSTIACASCHRPELAFADTLRVASGIDGRAGNRNTPSLLNRAYGRAFFWDARDRSLEDAVLDPIRNPREMDLATGRAVARLAGDAAYVAAFADAFPDDSLSARTLAFALASYIRTLRSGSSRVDRHAAGDTAALPADARRGRRLFLGRAGCGACHAGPNFTDESVHNTGVSWGRDAGHAAVTADTNHTGMFKTPTLRNVARTAPYMHDGSLRTLEDVVDFYDRGGTPNPNMDEDIHPLGLSPAEKRDLIAFLRALTGSDSLGFPAAGAYRSH